MGEAPANAPAIAPVGKSPARNQTGLTVPCLQPWRGCCPGTSG
jgi:hypothetical protein